MGAALGRRHGVAVGLHEAVARRRPVDRPFHLPRHAELFLKTHPPGEGSFGIGLVGAQLFLQVIGQPAGKAKGRLHRRVAIGQGRLPADLDAREEVGLRPCHAKEPVGLEAVVAKDFLVGVKGDRGAAAVGRRAHPFNRAPRLAAREFLHVEFAIARHLDPHAVGERVDHRRAHAVQPARGLVGLARKLAARVQRAQDHLERGFVGELRMRVHGNAAAVVADGHRMIGVQFHLDPAGMPGHGLVHRIVQHLGHQVVQSPFVGAADIHARALAHRFQPLEHLDGMGIVGIGRAGKEIGHGLLESSVLNWSSSRPPTPPLRKTWGTCNRKMNLPRSLAGPARAIDFPPAAT
jgi:hypothetical protein